MDDFDRSAQRSWWWNIADMGLVGLVIFALVSTQFAVNEEAGLEGDALVGPLVVPVLRWWFTGEAADTPFGEHGVVDLDLAMVDLQGEPVDPEDWAGRPVLMNVWAPWCGPCKAEMPSLDALQRKVDEDVVFAVVTDERYLDDARRLVKARGWTLPFLFLLGRLPEALEEHQGIPRTYVIDREGRLVWKHFGSTTFDEAFATRLGAL